MNINKVSSDELRKNPKKYAKECTTDQLLDALNLCKKDEERKQVITEILEMKPQVEKEFVKESGSSGLSLSTILDKFHADIDSYSFKHRLMETRAKNPELSFKCGLLKSCTLLVDGRVLSEAENDIFEEFNIDTADLSMLNRLKVELELDLKAFYSIETGNFIDISSNKWMQDGLKWMQEVYKKISEMKYANGRLDGKKIIPWHCALDDSPSSLRLHGENVVEYDLWDEYIPCDNHASSLELLNKVNAASLEELEKMYLEKDEDRDLKFWKHFYKDDEERYIFHLKEMLLIEFVDILNMYKSGDRFMVVKATYKDKELSDGEYINCWYVDVYSEKTKKIYRVLSI